MLYNLIVFIHILSKYDLVELIYHNTTGIQQQQQQYTITISIIIHPFIEPHKTIYIVTINALLI